MCLHLCTATTSDVLKSFPFTVMPLYKPLKLIHLPISFPINRLFRKTFDRDKKYLVYL